MHTCTAACKKNTWLPQDSKALAVELLPGIKHSRPIRNGEHYETLSHARQYQQADTPMSHKPFLPLSSLCTASQEASELFQPAW